MAKKVKKHFDPYIFYTTIALVVFGIIMVFSSSYVQAKFKMHDPYHFLKRNTIYAVLGFFIMICVSNLDYRKLKKWAPSIAGLTFLLLVLVLTPLGTELNGSKRWLGFGGLTIMPSEIAKFASIIVAAKIIDNKKDSISKGFKGIMPPLTISLTFFSLIVIEPHLSTAGTLMLTTFVMLFVAGMNMKIVWSLIGGGCALLTSFIALEPYRLKRFFSFLDPFKDPLGDGYQVIQSLYALGSGGLFGLGLGRSRQKFFYIPEPQNDFIFAIIGEELGYIGCIVLLLIFVFLIYRCIRIAINSPDTFSCMIVTGITAQIGIQTIINIAVATSSMPVTGVPLPFISYGGTSLIILMAAMGIVLNISKYVKLER